MSETWAIISDFILPHMGRIILNVIGFSLLGVLVATLLIIIFFRTKVFTRKNTVYKIIIRIIYIPFIAFITIYFFGNFGFVFGVYKVASAENEHLVETAYGLTVDSYFTSEASKKAFLKELTSMANDAENSVSGFANDLEKKVRDKPKTDEEEGLLAGAFKSYKHEIYKVTLKGLFSAVGMEFDTHTDYAEFQSAVKSLYDMDVRKIEYAIKKSLEVKIQDFIDKQYYTAIFSLFLFWLLLIAIPFVEFLIYKQWIERKALPDGHAPIIGGQLKSGLENEQKEFP